MRNFGQESEFKISTFDLDDAEYDTGPDVNSDYYITGFLIQFYSNVQKNNFYRYALDLNLYSGGPAQKFSDLFNMKLSKNSFYRGRLYNLLRKCIVDNPDYSNLYELEMTALNLRGSG